MSYDKDAEEFQHDWYGILDCNRDSTTQQIEKAARDFSRKYHPDKNPDPDAAAMFLLVQKAKEVLLDDTKRRIIDNYFKQKADIIANKAKKDATMDSNRKRMRDNFEANLKSASEAKLSHEQVLHNEVKKNAKRMHQLSKNQVNTLRIRPFRKHKSSKRCVKPCIMKMSTQAVKLK